MICTSRKTAQSYSRPRASHRTSIRLILCFGYWRTAGKTLHVFVPDVAEILYTDFTGEESIYGHHPQKGKRSEEHTSELQSHSDLVCRLLLEKKKKKKKNMKNNKNKKKKQK